MIIDLRSDTVTQPTQEMIEAMTCARTGDDTLGDDPTVMELEFLASNLLGKEAALFVCSGTMGNQIAVMTHTNRGEEVLLGHNSHIYNLEVGGLAALSQVQARPFIVENGAYNIFEIENMIQEHGIQKPKTGLICLENTNDLNEGLVVPKRNIDEVCNLAMKYKIPVHIDGARLFNAEIASGQKASHIIEKADSVMIALTKGLSAPFGAVIAGSSDFITEAKWHRQRLGGGLRQAGFMAAPGIVALKKMKPQLRRDHDNARRLSEMLSGIKGLSVFPQKVQTNIISCKIHQSIITTDDFIRALQEKNIKVKKIAKDKVRMVTHSGIVGSDLHFVVKSISDIMNNTFKMMETSF